MLDPYIEAVEDRRKRFVVYTPGDEPDVTDSLATRNVTVEHRQLPPDGPPGFVTIHDDGSFAGAVGLDDLAELLAPPVVRPGERDGLTDGYRALLDVLEETLFSSLDRRQLLATSREIEDRALRTGRGTLRVGFGSLSVFESQLHVYRHLAAETELDIHVYGRPDWSPPDVQNTTYHEDRNGSLAPFWWLTYDGGDDPTLACVLVAREREDGFVGFWSYDPHLVEAVNTTLRAVE